ncbi:MAG: tetratricopeptide repeat protein [Thermodesulfobacteriota bacterium]|jgi:tetratricopeptide (TPR) repeat protein
MGDENQQDKEKARAIEDSIPESGIFVQMAESLRLQGRYEEAIETLKGGLGTRPDALPARLLLGRCYLEKGLFTEAKEELEIVVRGIEECLPVYKMLSQVYLQEKDVDKALEVLRKTLYFQTAEDAVSKKVSPLEMGLLHRGSHPPFVTPPPFVIPPPPSAVPPAAPPASPQEAAREEGGVKEGEEGAKAVIQTDTLAEIYIKQGHLDRALSVYGEILSREPENAGVKEKYESLKKRMEKDRQAEARKKVQAKLERWLAVVSPRGGSTPS